MEEFSRLTIKGVLNTLGTVPKTIKLIYGIENKFLSVLIVLSILIGILPIMSLYASQELINCISINAEHNIIIQRLFLYGVIGIVSGLAIKCYAYVDTEFSMKLGYKINVMLLNKISLLNLNDFEKSDTYNKIEKITQESSYKPFQIIKAIITLITSIITLLTSVFYVMLWNPYASLILLFVPLVTIIIFLRMGQREFLIVWKRANDERKSWYWVHLLTHDFSFKEIKLNGVSDYIINSFKELKNRFIDEDLSLFKQRSVVNFIFEIVLQLLNIWIMVMVIISIRTGKLLIGNFVGIIRAIGMISENSQEIIEEIYVIYSSGLFMNEFFDFVNSSKHDIIFDKKSICNDFDSVMVDNVSYVYEDSNNGIHNVSLKFERNDLVAIVGENGSGKSTLTKLLSGLYKPQKGKIYYGAITDKELNQRFYEKNVAVLFQDFTKYELTIRENIGFGNIDEMKNYGKMVEILDKLNMTFLKTDDEYCMDTQLGSWFDEGRQLSGGEWQRVALARTFMKDAKLYILDEPNSALDPVIEKYIFDTFLNLSKNAITIFITHNILAAQKANQIIVMDKGSVVGVGNHGDLYENCKKYRELYDSDIYQKRCE